MDQGGRLQGVVAALVLHIRRGEMPQIVIDEFEQLARRAVVPLANARKQEGHIVCGALVHLEFLKEPRAYQNFLPNRNFSWAVSPLVCALLIEEMKFRLPSAC